MMEIEKRSVKEKKYENGQCRIRHTYNEKNELILSEGWYSDGTQKWIRVLNGQGKCIDFIDFDENGERTYKGWHWQIK